MIVVREFYANDFESPISISMVRESQVKYDALTINALLRFRMLLMSLIK